MTDAATTTETLLTQTRKSRGLSLATVAAAVGADPGNLSRIERGEQTPQRDLARKLFEYYDEVVPLGAIYDPAYSS
jgi:transcriptional regulator with XRE-family HTH domain